MRKPQCHLCEQDLEHIVGEEWACINGTCAAQDMIVAVPGTAPSSPPPATSYGVYLFSHGGAVTLAQLEWALRAARASGLTEVHVVPWTDTLIRLTTPEEDK